MQTLIEEYNKVLSKRRYAISSSGVASEAQRIKLATIGLQLMGVGFAVAGEPGSKYITIIRAPIEAIPAIEDLLFSLAINSGKADDILTVVAAVLASGQKQLVGVSPANAIARDFALRYHLEFDSAALSTASAGELINIAHEWLLPMACWSSQADMHAAHVAAFNALIAVLKYYRDEWKPTYEPAYYAAYQELNGRYERIRKAIQ